MKPLIFLVAFAAALLRHPVRPGVEAAISVFKKSFATELDNLKQQKSPCHLAAPLHDKDAKTVAGIRAFFTAYPREYVVGGSSALCLARFGSLAAINQTDGHEFGCDGDLEFYVVSKSDEDYTNFLRDLRSLCSTGQELGAWTSCLNHDCKKSYNGCMHHILQENNVDGFANDEHGQGNLPHPTLNIDFYDARDKGDKLKLHWCPQNYEVLKSTILPAKKSLFPVPADIQTFYEQMMPWGKMNAKEPEYGRGCKIAYPDFIMKTDTKQSLEQCATALEKAGLANFASCMQPGKAVEYKKVPDLISPDVTPNWMRAADGCRKAPK